MKVRKGCHLVRLPNIRNRVRVQFLLPVDYKKNTLHPHVAQQYDSEAFDSMAVMNSEIWNMEGADESGLSATDLLPNASVIVIT